jgi:hypothetical protein
MPEIAHQNGDPKAVVISPVLPYKSEIGLGQREEANQLAIIFGESQQLKSFCRGQQLAARHRSEA